MSVQPTASLAQGGVLATDLSAQSILDCSYGNEGCDGSLGAFHAYAEGLYAEQCDPYSGKSNVCASKLAQCAPTYFATTRQKYSAKDLGAREGGNADVQSRRPALGRAPTRAAAHGHGPMQAIKQSTFKEAFDLLSQARAFKGMGLSDGAWDEHGRAEATKAQGPSPKHKHPSRPPSQASL